MIGVHVRERRKACSATAVTDVTYAFCAVRCGFVDMPVTHLRDDDSCLNIDDWMRAMCVSAAEKNSATA